MVEADSRVHLHVAGFRGPRTTVKAWKITGSLGELGLGETGVSATGPAMQDQCFKIDVKPLKLSRDVEIFPCHQPPISHKYLWFIHYLNNLYECSG
jgi:hypothetical protein